MINRSIRLFFLVLWLGLHGIGFDAQAQRAWLKANVDSVLVGEHFELTLFAEHNANQKAIFPPASKPIGELELIHIQKAEKSQNGDKVTSKIVYEVAAFGIDSIAVSLPVGLLVGKDTTLVESAPLRLKMRRTAPLDAKGIEDITDIEEFADGWKKWLWIGALVLALGILFFYLWRRFRKQAEQEAPEVMTPERRLTPLEAALERLEALKSTDLEDKAHIKPYFTEISDTIRTYLERVLHISSLEMTTSELISAMQGSHKRSRMLVSQENREALKQVLDLADLVKFADFEPQTSDSQTALQQAKEVLEKIDQRQRPSPDTEGEQEKPEQNDTENNTGNNPENNPES